MTVFSKSSYPKKLRQFRGSLSIEKVLNLFKVLYNFDYEDLKNVVIFHRGDTGLADQALASQTRHWPHGPGTGLINQLVASQTRHWPHRPDTGLTDQALASKTKHWPHKPHRSLRSSSSRCSGPPKSPVVSPLKLSSQT